MKSAKPGRYCDGHGLWLYVTPAGTRSWILRYMKDGKSREMGLGPVRLVTLKEARERAHKEQRLLLDRIDPLEQRKAARGAAKLEAARGMTFSDAVEKYLASHETAWRNEKHCQQWRSTLATYAIPDLGALPLAEIDTARVLKVLTPIWPKRPETASRLRGRIEAILAWGIAQGLRPGPNPATWKNHLAKLLPAKSKVRAVRHHAAMPHADIPNFMGELRRNHSLSAYALQFTILCASRTGEVIGARWPEIDLSAAIWTIPSERMKAHKLHRVPLSGSAIGILKIAQDLYRTDDFVFPGVRIGVGLSNMAMAELLKGMRPGLTVHGFKSSFRDWVAEATTYPEWLAEAALAHAVADKVAAAYQRSDLLERRRELMSAWAGYCGSNAVTAVVAA